MELKILYSEIDYKAVRSSGAGGQHVNKVSSKVVLSFNFFKSNAFNENEKKRLVKFFSNRIIDSGVVQLTADENRSQFRNKKSVTDRFIKMIEDGLKVPKVRRKSKPSRSSIIKAKERKKRLSEKKKSRKKPNIDH
ncbi:MAG: alternative ribosome rescue aminoacyl-tRNA hydrolase ArfB [Crocinitomicaceae bacterium]